jgi:hypothetical protein
MPDEMKALFVLTIVIVGFLWVLLCPLAMGLAVM